MSRTDSNLPCPIRMALALAVASTLTACASTDRDRSGLLEPYRIDLPQGNYLTREMLGQVKLGMTRDQVRFALGSPLLTDVFLPDRWNYVFRYQHANGSAETRRVVIVFRNDRVAQVEADPLPRAEDPNDPALPGRRIGRQTSATGR